MAGIYEITGLRKKQIKLEKLRQILGDLVNRIAVPPAEISEEELVMMPLSFLKTIDELTHEELEDLLQGRRKFCILR
ncbi:MAG: hypothetical protein QME75_09190 [Deltaproteobacteria bacterium]|nr:hypothetical protein [Deltaproteobacteria bacterium]